jgi:hypothetical protein
MLWPLGITLLYVIFQITLVPTTQATLTSIAFDKIDKSEQEKYLNLI